VPAGKGMVLPGYFKTVLRKDKFSYICKVILEITPVFQDNPFTKLITVYNLVLDICNQGYRILRRGI
jgi:hypothetical protein